MPTVSKKQEKFMQAVAHNPKFAKAAGVPQSVGKEFTKSGGGMPVKPVSESKTRSQESDEAKRSAMSGMKKGGMAKSNPFMEMIAKKKEMAGKKDKMPMKKGGMATKKMASGGLAGGHKSADGIASKGKTKAKQVMMKSGGRTC